MGSRFSQIALAAVVVLAAASAPEPRAQEAVFGSGGILDSPVPDRVNLRCPGDLVVDCDGAGNLAERDAWLAGFEASTNGPCQPAEVSFRFVQGELVSTIAYPDFTDLSAWTLNGVTGTLGNPVVSGGRPVLRLTNGLGQSGTAFLSNTVSLAGDASFSVSFSFAIPNPIGSGDGDGIGADGLAFVMQTVSNNAGGSGGGIGYQGISPSVVVEFDTYNNGAWDSNNGNHAGINLNGDVASIALAPVSPRFNDGAIWHAWVDFDGPSRLLEVRVSQSPLRPPAPLLQEVVDVTGILGGTSAFLGFTSGTGSAGGFHDVLSFFFANTRDAQRCGAGAGVQTVIATGTDACGDAVDCARLFIVEDSVPPVLAATPLSGCFSRVAEAEAAALASTTVTDACALPVSLSATTSGGCDAVVTVLAVDDCGNEASIDHAARIDAAPPAIAPTDGLLTCGGQWRVIADAWDGADAAPAVAVLDGCGGAFVENDRTSGGAVAADRYPCGRTPVLFTATDDCGRIARCEIEVVVEPAAAPPALGPVLRVSKDASGMPWLDWSLFGPPPPAVLFSLRRQGPGAGRRLLELSGTVQAGTRWRDPRPGPWLVFYDVRSLTCEGSESVD